MSAALQLTPPLAHEPAGLLRWVGSKQRFAPMIAARVLGALRPGGVYREPFAGSLAVFYRMRAHGWCGAAALSDILGPLIAFYRALEANPAALVGALALHQEALSEDDYYETRRAFNQATARGRGEGATQAARFVYLNARSYNALWRSNKKGEMSTPFGGEEGRPLPRPERVFAASAPLRGAVLRCADFAESIDAAQPGDVVYADPPYDGSFQSYAGVFDDGEQARLRHKLLAAWERGVAVFASNRDTPRVRALYGAPFQIEPLPIHYQVGGRAARRQDAQEVFLYALPRA